MRVWLTIILLAATCGAAAQTTYRWVDKDGKVHYGDKPPAPGEAKSVQQKKASQLGVTSQDLPYSVRQAVADFPVTFYSQPQCGEFCVSGRELLTQRGIPFTDKAVTTDADTANLKSLLGGAEAALPVLQVGSRVIKGFRAEEWDKLLDAAGYPKAKATSSKP
jgi:glutaredoxin